MVHAIVRVLLQMRDKLNSALTYVILHYAFCPGKLSWQVRTPLNFLVILILKLEHSFLFELVVEAKYLVCPMFSQRDVLIKLQALER